jgi:hypothetical protein
MSQLDETMPPDRDLVPTDPLQRAVWYGIDLTLLRENLRRTPTERLENHRRALEAVEAIRKAAREHRIRAEVYGLPCSVLTLEGLIRAKRAAGRPKVSAPCMN